MRIAAAVLLLLLVATGAPAQTAWPVESLGDLNRLPELVPGWSLVQVSSHDHFGGNRDGFLGTFSGLRREGDQTVLMEDAGPGCVVRIWMTDVAHIQSIRLYLDGQAAPALEVSAAQFFALAPPLTAGPDRSSGGYVSYLPIPFEKRIKIAVTGSPRFYAVEYYRFAAGTAVRSHVPTLDELPFADTWKDERLGTAPDCGADCERVEKTVRLAPGGAVTLARAEGPATIAALRIALRPDTWDALAALRLSIRYDEEHAPAVDLPLSDFFALPTPGGNLRSLPIGRADDGAYYCHFPMPFLARAEIGLRNDGTAPADASSVVLLRRAAPSARAGYFRATAAQDETRVGEDYTALRVGGRGKVVGIWMSMEGPADRMYLEGDERFYFDSSRHPAVYGTGTEDFFNGGWYFERGPFSLASHGHQAHVAGERDRTDGYRWFLVDPLPFHGDVTLRIQHDAGDQLGGDRYRSVVYYYHRPERSLVLTDRLDVGDADSERLHQYQSAGAERLGLDMFFYEGEKDRVPVADEGRCVRRRSSFTVRIDPAGEGVRLRRRLDRAIADQEATVFVDGKPVGVWLTAGANTLKRWAESDFDIGPEFTRGKDRIEVTLRVQGSGAWTEYTYWVYSFLPPPGAASAR